MTEREILLAMAAHIEATGFKPSLGWLGGCGCFCNARYGLPDIAGRGLKTPDDVPPVLLDVIGAKSFLDDDLVAAGWVVGSAPDAVAACLIAADLAA